MEVRYIFNSPKGNINGGEIIIRFSNVKCNINNVGSEPSKWLWGW